MTCMGCKDAFDSPDKTQRLCAECNWRQGYGTARLIDPTIPDDPPDRLSPVRMEIYHRVQTALWQLSAGWDWSESQADWLARAVADEVRHLSR